MVSIISAKTSRSHQCVTKFGLASLLAVLGPCGWNPEEEAAEYKTFTEGASGRLVLGVGWCSVLCVVIYFGSHGVQAMAIEATTLFRFIQAVVSMGDVLNLLFFTMSE